MIIDKFNKKIFHEDYFLIISIHENNYLKGRQGVFGEAKPVDTKPALEQNPFYYENEPLNSIKNNACKCPCLVGCCNNSSEEQLIKTRHVEFDSRSSLGFFKKLKKI